VPIAWEELSPALKPNQFTLANLPARLARLKRDPWRDIAKVGQSLPEPSKAARGKSRRA
jgi:bifunctional non-homologous end joining protein LigD